VSRGCTSLSIAITRSGRADLEALFEYRIDFFPRISVASISSPTSPQVADDITPPIVASCPVTRNNPRDGYAYPSNRQKWTPRDTTLLFRVSLFLPRCLSEIGYLQLYVTFSTILFPFYSDSVFRVPSIVVPCCSTFVLYSCRESHRGWTAQECASLRELSLSLSLSLSPSWALYIWDTRDTNYTLYYRRVTLSHCAVLIAPRAIRSLPAWLTAAIARLS